MLGRRAGWSFADLCDVRAVVGVPRERRAAGTGWTPQRTGASTRSVIAHPETVPRAFKSAI